MAPGFVLASAFVFDVGGHTKGGRASWGQHSLIRGGGSRPWESLLKIV